MTDAELMCGRSCAHPRAAMSPFQDAESTHGSGDADSYSYYSYSPSSDRSEDERSEEERSAERPPQRQSSHNSEVSESEEASPKESASCSEVKLEEWEPPVSEGRLQKAKEMVEQSMTELDLAQKAQS